VTNDKVRSQGDDFVNITVEGDALVSEVTTLQAWTPVLLATSSFFATTITTRDPADKEALVVECPEIKEEACELFLFWAYHAAVPMFTSKINTAEEYTVCQLIGDSYLFAELWRVAEKFDSNDFRNWLVTIAYKLCRACSAAGNGAGPVTSMILGMMDTLTTAGFTNCIPYHMLTEFLVYTWVHFGYEWQQLSRQDGWTEAGRGLFGSITKKNPELLLAIFQREDQMKGMKEGGRLIHPGKNFCARWHVHQQLLDKGSCDIKRAG
jgi:hypothetical protein